MSGGKTNLGPAWGFQFERIKFGVKPNRAKQIIAPEYTYVPAYCTYAHTQAWPKRDASLLGIETERKEEGE